MSDPPHTGVTGAQVTATGAAVLHPTGTTVLPVTANSITEPVQHPLPRSSNRHGVTAPSNHISTAADVYTTLHTAHCTASTSTVRTTRRHLLLHPSRRSVRDLWPSPGATFHVVGGTPGDGPFRRLSGETWRSSPRFRRRLKKLSPPLTGLSPAVSPSARGRGGAEGGRIRPSAAADHGALPRREMTWEGMVTGRERM